MWPFGQEICFPSSTNIILDAQCFQLSSGSSHSKDSVIYKTCSQTYEVFHHVMRFLNVNPEPRESSHQPGLETTEPGMFAEPNRT